MTREASSWADRPSILAGLEAAEWSWYNISSDDLLDPSAASSTLFSTPDLNAFPLITDQPCG